MFGRRFWSGLFWLAILAGGGLIIAGGQLTQCLHVRGESAPNCSLTSNPTGTVLLVVGIFVSVGTMGVFVMGTRRELNRIAPRISGRNKSTLLLPGKLTFEAAKGVADAYTVMEGDFGSQCYLTAPMRWVSCKETVLRQLLLDLDKICSDDPAGRSLYFERHTPGEHIDSGMGGGYILDDVWIHPKLVDFGLRDRILAVFSGRKPDLDLAPKKVEELRRRYADQEQRSKYDSF